MLLTKKRDDADANNNPLYGLPHKYEVRGGGEAAENWSDEQWDKADLLWSGSQMTKEATGKISDKFKNKNYRYIRVKLTGIPHHKLMLIQMTIMHGQKLQNLQYMVKPQQNTKLYLMVQLKQL